MTVSGSGISLTELPQDVDWPSLKELVRLGGAGAFFVRDLDERIFAACRRVVSGSSGRGKGRLILGGVAAEEKGSLIITILRHFPFNRTINT